MICTVFLVISGCKKDNPKTTYNFNYELAEGKWVLYEITSDTGSIQSGPFTSNSIFGVYAESVQLNKDKTYIPMSWVDKNNFTLKTDEAGNFEYSANNKLRFYGTFNLEWELNKFQGDELWLELQTNSDSFLHKFRRQQ